MSIPQEFSYRRFRIKMLRTVVIRQIPYLMTRQCFHTGNLIQRWLNRTEKWQPNCIPEKSFTKRKQWIFNSSWWVFNQTLLGKARLLQPIFFTFLCIIHAAWVRWDIIRISFAIFAQFCLNHEYWEKQCNANVYFHVVMLFRIETNRADCMPLTVLVVIFMTDSISAIPFSNSDNDVEAC